MTEITEIENCDQCLAVKHGGYLCFVCFGICHYIAMLLCHKGNMERTARKVLMMTGMFAVLFYLLHIIVGGILWKDYDHLQQPISDLTASGAPNRVIPLVLTTIYSILSTIFALSFSLLESRNHSKIVMWGGFIFLIMNLLSVSYSLFPEDLPGIDHTFPGMMHIVVTALIVPFTILSPFVIGLGFLKEEIWKPFGRGSILAGTLILIFGGTTAAFYAMKLPYFGLVERMNIGVLQLWLFCFSFKLTTLG